MDINWELLGLYGITWLNMGGQGYNAQRIVNYVEYQLTIVSFLK